MVTTTVHRPKNIGRIIENRESELTHALLRTRLACSSVVLPVKKMTVGHCPINNRPELNASWIAAKELGWHARRQRGGKWHTACPECATDNWKLWSW